MSFFRLVWQFSYKVVQRFRQDRCSRVAGALSFATLLALVPLTAVTFAVFSHLSVFESWMALAQEFIYSNLVPASGEVVSRYLRKFAANTDRLTLWGLILLAGTSLMVMATIERIFNDIWHVPQTRKRIHRYLSYAALLILGPVLVGLSLSATSHLISLPLFSIRTPFGPLPAFLFGAVAIVLGWFAFTLLYAVVPNHPVRWRHALAGSFFTTAWLEIAKHSFGFFVIHFSSYQAIYGALAALPMFLIWIYLSWTIILLGAVVTASLPEWKNPPQKEVF